MDLYKWAYKLGPAVPASCWPTASRSPPTSASWTCAPPPTTCDAGFPAVAIETPEGKAEYAAAQRGFAARGAELRRRLLDVCGSLTLA